MICRGDDRAVLLPMAHAEATDRPVDHSKPNHKPNRIADRTSKRGTGCGCTEQDKDNVALTSTTLSTVARIRL